ncbi:MAG: hypothetical protein F6K19_37520 [Cyanothece sp. SIO1E1]|nr:hypothetical protein [Cyanothece sp. SIO1E1]
MNALWYRFLRSAYRREPFFSFVATAGAVDAVIGGLWGRGTLLGFGIGTVGLAIAIRWWKMQRQRVEHSAQAPVHYLPERPSRPQLPTLNIPGKQPPKT